jgi:hypothetical protein
LDPIHSRIQNSTLLWISDFRSSSILGSRIQFYFGSQIRVQIPVLRIQNPTLFLDLRFQIQIHSRIQNPILSWISDFRSKSILGSGTQLYFGSQISDPKSILGSRFQYYFGSQTSDPIPLWISDFRSKIQNSTSSFGSQISDPILI